MVRVTSRHINEYIKEVMGEHFSAKDFRTWAGTLICASALARVGIIKEDSKSARNKKVVAAIKETAEALGNTPAVCRKSFICPAVLSSYEKGQVVSKYFPSLESFLHYRGSQLHAAEKSLVRFLKQNGSC
jgi:DNA topoisomerase-1